MKHVMFRITSSIAVLSLLVPVLPAHAVSDLPNGSFEEYDDTWHCDDKCTAGNEYVYMVYTTDANNLPPDGIWYLYIFREAGLYQNLIVPTDAVSLSFYYYNTQDVSEVMNNDGVFTISLTDINTAEVYAQQTFSDQGTTWQAAAIDIPVAAQGQEAQLYISNGGGFTRLDYLQFIAASDLVEEEPVEEPSYPTVKLQVFNSKNKTVKDAQVFIKKNGARLPLLNLKTNKSVTSLTTNKKGKTAKFIIVEELEEGETVKLCVKKKKVKECAAIAPEGNVVTDYEFAFTSKKVTMMDVLRYE